MTETLANWYSSESTRRELSNEYQQNRVWMDFKDVSGFISCVKVAAALKGLRLNPLSALLQTLLPLTPMLLVANINDVKNLRNCRNPGKWVLI